MGVAGRGLHACSSTYYLILSTPSKDGLKKPLIEKPSPVNTGLPDRNLVKKWAFSEFP